MALSDTFVRAAKASGRPAGDKHADGFGLYLLVKPAGKYWRMDYRFAGMRRTLALGVYPAVSLAKARRPVTLRASCWPMAKTRARPNGPRKPRA